MTLYDLADKLTLLSPVMLSAGIVAGCRRYSSLNPAYRLIFFYLALCVTFDILTRIPFLVWKTNLILLVLFSLSELCLFYLLYLKLYTRKNLILKVVVPAGTGYILWELLYIDFKDPQQFQSYAKVVDTLCIMAMSIGYFFDRLNKPVKDIWFFFGMNAAILICFAFYIVFYIPINFLIRENAAFQLYLWLLHLFVTIGFYVYIAVELWKSGKHPKRLPSGY